MKKNVRVLSFFTGGGGLDLGFHQAGFEIVYASDLIPLFCSSLDANKGTYVSPSTIVEAKDIRDVDPEKLPDDIDFIIGGPPCQTFSASGRRAGGAAGQLDQRGTLFQAYGAIIKAKKPKGFLFENVRGILGSNKGKDWVDIKNYFLDLGYNLDFRILDACDFGVPQHRERLILVGHKMERNFLFPRPLYGPDSKDKAPHIGAKQAFEQITENAEAKNLKFTGGKYSHLLKLVPPGENYLFFTEKRGYPNPIFAYRSRFSDFLYKADPQKPTKTIIASPGKYTGPLHWDNRYFTINEYKIIQGFPLDYKFMGNRIEQIRQIGNSVSPKIAYKLAQSVLHQIFELKVKDIDLLDVNETLSFDQRKGTKASATKIKHYEIRNKKRKNNKNKFILENYETTILPYNSSIEMPNVKASKLDENRMKIDVYGEDSTTNFIKMTLGIGILDSDSANESYEKTIEINVYGEGDHCVQTMWNTIDDWIIRSSNFHSLFEIYGHFTEPHPDFRILSFETFSNHPICIFAEYVSDFKNCSKFFDKRELMELFSGLFKKSDWVDLLVYLRKYRFDVRSREINIAIDPNKYMIAYPFTLPLRKQMNFKPKYLQQETI